MVLRLLSGQGSSNAEGLSDLVEVSWATEPPTWRSGGQPVLCKSAQAAAVGPRVLDRAEAVRERRPAAVNLRYNRAQRLTSIIRKVSSAA